jgi:hypothetical protein
MLIYTSKLRIFIPCMPCQKLPKHAKMVLGGAGLRLRLRLRGMVMIYFVNEYHLVAGLRLRGVRNIDNLVNCPLGFIKYFIILNFKTRL